MARTIITPKSQEVGGAEFLEDIHGWPFTVGDVVFAFCPEKSDMLECRVVGIKNATYHPLTLMLRGIVELQVSDNEELGDIKFEAESEGCVLVQGEPNNKNLLRRHEFEEYRAELLRS